MADPESSPRTPWEMFDLIDELILRYGVDLASGAW
jgi:hypothetical protein